jgi:uncharacterized protein YggE
MTQVGTICIEEEILEVVEADGVWLTVQISGSNFFVGNAALEKAAELKQFVAELANEGIAKEQIAIARVSIASAAQGFLGKSTQAAYTVLIKLVECDRVAAVLGAIARQKNAALLNLEWRYESLLAKRRAWVETCIQNANERARLVARGLGVRLLGVKQYTESNLGEGRDRGAGITGYGDFSAMKVRRRELDAGLDFKNSEEFGVKIIVEYYVSAFDENSSVAGSFAESQTS